MTPEKDNNLHLEAERRSDRSGRGHASGETTAFEIKELRQGLGVGPRPQVPMFVVVSGVQRGRPFMIERLAQSIGRGALCDVALHGRGISRIHMKVEWDRANKRVVVEDASSTNGIYIDGARVQRERLSEGDVVYIGPETAIRLEFLPDTDAQLRVRQYENSIVDELTGIHNRRYLMSSLEHELAFTQRHGQSLCLLLVDIDHFKRVNDEYGHPVGDAVIQQLAALVANSLRSEDNFARLGGEEFAIVSRGLTPDSASQLAERLRAKVESQTFEHQQVKLHCTVSLGGAMTRIDEECGVSDFIKRADENLYEAKNSGRNRCVLV